MRTAFRLLAATVAVIVLTPASAHSHASLVESDPEEGQALKVAPESVSLTLSEPVAEPVFVAVTDAADEVVKTAPAEIEVRTVTAKLLGELEEGEYALSYRLVSADAHVVTGTLDFSLASPAASPASPAPSPPQAELAPSAADEDSGTDRDRLLVGGGVAFALALAGLLYFVRLGLRSRAGDDGS